MLGGQELLIALSQESPFYDCTIPLAKAVAYEDYLVLGFANGVIRIYGIGNDQIFTLYSHIDPSRNGKNSSVTNLHLFQADGDIKSQAGESRLVATFEDGTVSLYSFPSGIIRNTVKLRYSCRGLDCHFELRQGVEKGILVWGQTQEVCVLDRSSLDVLAKVNASLSNWPIPVPLFDDQLLLISLSGEASIWKILTEHKTVYRVDDFLINDLISEPPQSAGHFHDVDLIIAVLKIDQFTWVVVQRHGWTIFRWDSAGSTSERLVRDTGACFEDPLVYAFLCPDTEMCFGVVTNNGSIYVVNDQQVQLLEPAWSGSFVDAFYRDSRVWVIVEHNGMIMVYTSTHVSKSSPIHWETDFSLVEDSFGGKRLSKSLTCKTKYKDRLLVIKASNGEVQAYNDLTSWIEKTPYSVCSFTDDHKEAATALDLHNVSSNSIMMSTSLGRIIYFRLDPVNGVISIDRTVDCIASSPIIQLLTPSDSAQSDLVLALAVNMTISVVDGSTGLLQKVIPGNCFCVAKVSVYTADSNKHNYLVVSYINGTQRCWNLSSGKSYSLSEIELNCSSVTEFVDCMHMPYIVTNGNENSTPKPRVVTQECASVLVSSNDVYSDTELSAISDVIRSRSCGIALQDSGSTSTSGISTAYNNYTDNLGNGVDGYCVLILVCALAHFDRAGNEESLMKFMLSQKLPSIGTVCEFIATRCRPGSDVYLFARKVLEKLLKLELQERDIQRQAEKWLAELPSRTSGNIYAENSLRSLILVGALCRVLPSDYSNKHDYQRQVADSLMMYLNESCPRLNQEIAIEMIGKGWDLWEKFFNPLHIVNTLVLVLIQNGFTMLSRKSFMDMESWSYEIQNCAKCLQNVAFHNIVLLLSTLTTHVSDESRALDTRIASLKVLTFLIAYPATQALIGPHSLSSIVTPVVKCLDSSESNATDVPKSATSSIISEATLFLSTLISIYPDYMAFHRGQQRLAVSLIPEHLTSTFKGIMAFVYDLRTGTLVSSLGLDYSVNATKMDAEGPVKITTVLPGSVCENIAFAPDGKHLAAIIRHTSDIGMPESSSAKDRAVTIAIWRISFGIISLFKALATVSSAHPSHMGSNSQKDSNTGSIIKPVSLSLCKIRVAEYFNFRWQSDKTLLLESDVSTKAIKISI